jgi:hypothetical protein
VRGNGGKWRQESVPARYGYKRMTQVSRKERAERWLIAGKYTCFFGENE